MKTVILSAAFAAVLLVGSYVGYKSMVTNEEFSDLELANIEALADGETQANCTFSEIKANQEKNELTCKGKGTLCCIMPQ